MNWSLIFRLSLFGLVMALATISLIPMKVEPFVWLAIFLFCAWAIAKQAPGKYFIHGLLVSLVNSIWITAAHLLFFQTYAANHPTMAEMSASMPLANHPRRMMLFMGPFFGAASGIVLGLLAFGASRIFKRTNVQ